MEALLVSMRFLRTQFEEPQIWADWKWSRLLPLVVLALRGPEKALRWLSSQFLRYSFCTVCWSGIEMLTLTHHEHERLFFPHRPALHHLLCYRIDSCGNFQKGHLGFSVHPFMTYHFYCGQEYVQQCAQAHKRQMFPLAVLARETFQKATLLHPGGTREKGEMKPRFYW